MAQLTESTSSLRFSLIEISEGAYNVLDSEHEQWNMPELALSMNVNNKDHASTIASLMNLSWLAYLRGVA